MAAKSDIENRHTVFGGQRKPARRQRSIIFFACHRDIPRFIRGPKPGQHWQRW